MDLAYYRNQAQIKQKEHQKLLDGLKKKPPKNLDYLVQELHDEVFNEIDCQECAQCCSTTGPLFTEKDIERISKLLKQKPLVFEEKYLKMDEDNDKILKELPCRFLSQDNRCSIYEQRPKACREYPHTDRKKICQINPITIKNAHICPAVYLFLEKMKERLTQ